MYLSWGLGHVLSRTDFISGHIVRGSRYMGFHHFFAGYILARRMLTGFTYFSSGHIQATTSADNSKVEFRWCYKHHNSIFIMKTIVTVDGWRTETNSVFLIDFPQPQTARRSPLIFTHFSSGHIQPTIKQTAARLLFIIKIILLQLWVVERNPFAYSWTQKNQTRHRDESGLKTK